MFRALYTVENHDEALRKSAWEAQRLVCGGLIHEVFRHRNAEAQRLPAPR